MTGSAGSGATSAQRSWMLLHDAGASDRSIVGGKALALGQAAAEGLAAEVPPGVVFTTAFFEHVAASTAIAQGRTDAAATISLTRVRTGEQLQKLRQLILTAPWPEEALQEISIACAGMLAQGPVVVRSSMPQEDGEHDAHAGTYHSEAGARTPEDVEQALRRCWASAYTERATYLRPLSHRVAAIMQHQVDIARAGVLFTADPVSGAPSLIAEHAATSDGVTSGQGGTQQHLDPEDPVMTHLREGNAAGLVELARRCEKLAGGPVDLEWAEDRSGSLRLLQWRRITALAETAAPKIGWISQEDIERVHAAPLGHCERLFMRGLQKKIWYRRACQQRDIEVYRIWYVTVGSSGLEERSADLLAQLRFPSVRVNWGNHSEDVRAEDLEQVLIDNRWRNPVGVGAEHGVAQVGEVIRADAEGFSSMLGERGYIEAFGADIEHLKSGSERPRLIDVLPGGEVQRSGQGMGREISDDAAREIVRATRELSEMFGEVRAEWYTSGEQVFIKDLSIEEQALGGEGSTVISAGFAEGTALVLGDLSAYDELAENYGLSVVTHSSEQERAGSDPIVTAVRERAERGEKLIVVAPYPSIGLIPLLPHVCGAVFEHGSLLCHTAIVLREQRVPAIISAQASTVRSGQRLQISPAGMRLAEHAGAPAEQPGSSDLEEFIARAMSLLPEVLGSCQPESIGFQGAIGRGLVSEGSDVDLLLGFPDQARADAAPRGNFMLGGMEWDVYHVVLEGAHPESWRDKVRYFYGYETRIVKDPQGRLQALCTRARLSPAEQRQRVGHLISEIANRGVTPEGKLQAYRGITGIVRPDVWLRRGDAFSAHMRLNQVRDRIVELLFALNSLPAPSLKRRDHLAMKLPWQPDGLERQMHGLALISEFSEPEFHRRLQCAEALLRSCGQRAQKLSLLPGNLLAHAGGYQDGAISAPGSLEGG